jgi:hypothetical protein
MGRDPVSLGHLAVEGGQLPQPRGVLPVLGMALPIHMVNQVIGLIDPRGLDKWPCRYTRGGKDLGPAREALQASEVRGEGHSY